MTDPKAPSPLDGVGAPALFRQAAEYMAAGNPAAATLLPSLERFPDYAPGWLLIGDVLRLAGKRDAAATALRLAFQRRHSSAVLTHRIGQGFVELGDRSGAIMAFRKAVALDPHLAAAWYSLGLSLEDLRDYAEAAVAYRAALRLQPNRAHILAMHIRKSVAGHASQPVRHGEPRRNRLRNEVHQGWVTTEDDAHNALIGARPAPLQSSSGMVANRTARCQPRYFALRVSSSIAGSKRRSIDQLRAKAWGTG